MAEYEVVTKGSNDTIIQAGAVIGLLIGLTGAIIGLIIDKDNKEIWQSVLLLILGALIPIVKDAAASLKNRLNKPKEEELHEQKKTIAKNITKDLPEKHKAKIAKALWKSLTPETREVISRSDSEDSMSAKAKSSEGLSIPPQ